eukprot:gene12734-15980_t
MICRKTEMLVRDALNLNSSMAMDMMVVYNKHLETGTRGSERKHVLMIAVSAYVTCEARTIDDICMGLDIESAEFHKTMRQMNIDPPDLSVMENVASVRNKLRLKGRDAFEFKKRCTRFYQRIMDKPNGVKIVNQVKATKLFAVIGHIVLRDMTSLTHTAKYKDADVFKILCITPPTVKKIEKILSAFT